MLTTQAMVVIFHMDIIKRPTEVGMRLTQPFHLHGGLTVSSQSFALLRQLSCQV